MDALEDVDHALFEEVIWPALYERVPAFRASESSRPGRASTSSAHSTRTPSSAGTRTRNLVVAAGFSGQRGCRLGQHAPGVGRAVAELIDHGGYGQGVLVVRSST